MIGKTTSKDLTDEIDSKFYELLDSLLVQRQLAVVLADKLISILGSSTLTLFKVIKDDPSTIDLVRKIVVAKRYDTILKNIMEMSENYMMDNRLTLSGLKNNKFDEVMNYLNSNLLIDCFWEKTSPDVGFTGQFYLFKIHEESNIPSRFMFGDFPSFVKVVELLSSKGNEMAWDVITRQLRDKGYEIDIETMSVKVCMTSHSLIMTTSEEKLKRFLKEFSV